MADANAPQKADIFGSAAPGAGQAAKAKPKRTKLTNSDSVAAKCFDPLGASIIDDLPLETLWGIAKKGDKWCEYHTELAASGDEYRQGIALSKLCEVSDAAGTVLETTQDLKQCLNKDVFDKALTEYRTLKPHFKKMNAGKDFLQGSGKEETFGNLKKRKREPDADGKTPATPQELEASAKAVHQWLLRGTASNFRMLVNILSQGGVFYAMQAMDKTARAWTQHDDPQVSEATFVSIAKALRTNASTSTARSSKERPTGNLF